MSHHRGLRHAHSRLVASLRRGVPRLPSRLDRGDPEGPQRRHPAAGLLRHGRTGRQTDRAGRLDPPIQERLPRLGPASRSPARPPWPPRRPECGSATRLEAEPFTRRQRSVVIRHASDDRIIALIEILSAGNKSSNKEFRAFVTKAVDFLDRGLSSAPDRSPPADESRPRRDPSRHLGRGSGGRRSRSRPTSR